MKIVVNKKRNTAFLFEVLSRELTRQIIKKDKEKQKEILTVFKEFFSKDKPLGQELKLYKYLNETRNLSESNAKELVKRTIVEHNILDQKEIFNEQSKVISYINKSLGTQAFAQFIPNYKNLATISQIFNSKISLPNKILLENIAVNHICSKLEEEAKPESVLRNSVVTAYAKLFNKSYSGLLEEQKQLLQKFIYSVNDAAEFKTFLNEELSRLNSELRKFEKDKDIISDPQMVEKYNKTFESLNEFRQNKPLTEEMISNLMKVQSLVKELQNDGSSAS